MNTKQTEIGEIPEDWEVVKLGEILTPSNERINPLYQFSDFCIELEHIQSNLGMLSGSTQTNKYSSLKNVFKKDDVLFGKLRAYLRKFWFAQKDGVCSTEIWVLKTNLKKAIPNFSYYIVQSDNFIEAASESYGTHMPRSEWKTVKELTIPLPPFPEQTAIAAILSDTDRLLAALRALIGKKRAVKTAAMQRLLSGRLRLPGFASNDRMKNSELGEIPEDWEVVKLGEIANINMGQSPNSSNYNKSGDGLPLLQGNADIANRKAIIRNYTTQITKVADSGDILLSVRAPVGAVAKTDFECCIGRGLCSIKFPNEYLYQYLIFFENQWEQYSKGSTFDSINSNELKEILLPIPKSKPEQTAIAQTLSDMDSEIAALEARAAKLACIKQGLMQNLLTGKTRVPVKAA
ncbi:restriction endonuclease subunit S [Cardiobacterium hominis]|uniref:restriction endonuclease subunit S n=1 Tax=Cardiobacterium hominis TaxID=2718 RepID=UPI0028F159A8|nr:restriction endonuclease subunit S [Cardiobacterium hominis]